MINPFLQARIAELPLRPLLIETEPERFDEVLRAFQLEGLQIRTSIRQFAMIGVPPVPSRWIEALNRLPGVSVVHADLETSISQIPGTSSDPNDWFPTSESRRVLGAEEAFQAGITGETLRLCIIDTGVDPTHEQLQGAEVQSTVRTPPEPGIDAGPQASGHGSHVASTAAGRRFFTPVQVSVEGVSRAQIFSVQALGRVIGTGFTSEIINAINEGWERGARIFNMSLGSRECQGTCTTCPECRVIKTLTDRGGIFCIAAGNSGPNPNTINCPGCVPSALTVAATDRFGQVARFSSRGGNRFSGKPDVSAPGVDIYSGTGRATQVDLGDPGASPGYAAISGTSMATPHVAGFVALVRQRNPTLSVEGFKAVMRQGRDFNANTGWGVPEWRLFA